MSNARRMTKPPKKKLPLPNHSNGFDPVLQVVNSKDISLSRGSISPSTGLLSNVPYSKPTASNVFGIGSEHPFANYWTCRGGLPETIGVLPEKIQSDILLERYFECVDAVYPMIHRQTFYADYEHFWSIKDRDNVDDVDGALVALLFAMLALGNQFATLHPLGSQRQESAEFYVSAAHQSLRMSSYLNKASVRSIQAMVLITYFLINDNHASDGWAFAGILIRQAYAMGLHRDPNIVCPNANIFEKQQRRKLWQAVLLQDTFLTVLLSLPPNATHTDVSVDDLIDSPSSIAQESPTDTMYIRGCWHLANLVQESICSPRSLDLPICTSPRQKTKLLADFKTVYRSFPDVFRSWTPESLEVMAQDNKRLVRQTLFLTSNYFHNLMLLHSSECKDTNPLIAPVPSMAPSPVSGSFPTSAVGISNITQIPGQIGVQKNIRGALEAAHDAINAFFLLYKILPAEARIWWVFNHRAFLEALCIAEILKEYGDQGEDTENGALSLAGGKDPTFVRAKADVVHMINIMNEMSSTEHGSEVAKTRVSVLRNYL